MAVTVVDGLETVQVQIQDGRLAAAAGRLQQGMLDAVFQQAPVRQTRQGVMQRQFLLLLAVLRQFLVQQAHFQHVVDAFVHFHQVERFADEVARTRFQGGDLETRLCRQGQHGQVAAMLDFLQAFHDLEAVQLRHLQIQQNQVVAMFPVQRTDLSRTHGGHDIGVAGIAQDFQHQVDIVGRIVDDQNFGFQNLILAGHVGSRLIRSMQRWLLPLMIG